MDENELRRIRALLGDEPGALQAATLQELLRKPAVGPQTSAQPLEQPQASADLGAFQQMLEDDPGMLDALLTSGEAPGERQILAQEAAIAKHLSGLPSAQGRQVGQVYSAPSIFEALSSSGLQLRGQQLQRENLAAQRDVLGQETEGLRRLVKSRAAPDALDLGASLAGPRAVPFQQALDQRKARALEKTLAAKWMAQQAAQQSRAAMQQEALGAKEKLQTNELGFRAGEGEANRGLKRETTGQQIASNEKIAAEANRTRLQIAAMANARATAAAKVAGDLKLEAEEAKFIDKLGKDLTLPPTRSPFGIQKILHDKAERVLNIVDQGSSDPFNLPRQQQDELAIAVGTLVQGAASSGGAVTNKQFEAFRPPKDYLTNPISLWQWLSREPQGMKQRGFVKLLLGLANREMASIGAQMRKSQQAAIARNRPLMSKYPASSGALLEELGLSDLAVPGTPAKEPEEAPPVFDPATMEIVNE